VGRLEEESGARVAFLTRLGEGMLPGEGTIVQDGDLVHVIMRDTDAERVETVFAKGPEAH
jgi:trk system potassium uptake protein TrkA